MGGGGLFLFAFVLIFSLSCFVVVLLLCFFVVVVVAFFSVVLSYPEVTVFG